MSSPKRRVILTDEAEDDIESIALYGVMTWGDQQAERYFIEIADALDNLALFPHMGRLKVDLPHDIRSLGVGHHRILFRIEPEIIRVLRILHERMDATHHLEV